MCDAVTACGVSILSRCNRSDGRLCSIVEPIVGNEILSSCGNCCITRRGSVSRRRDDKNDAEGRSDQLFPDMDVFFGAWHEGNVPIMGPRTHGAWLGSTVFDGARAFEGVAPGLDLHCARVNHSARNFRLC